MFLAHVCIFFQMRENRDWKQDRQKELPERIQKAWTSKEGYVSEAELKGKARKGGKADRYLFSKYPKSEELGQGSDSFCWCWIEKIGRRGKRLRKELNINVSYVGEW